MKLEWLEANYMLYLLGQRKKCTKANQRWARLMQEPQYITQSNPPKPSSLITVPIFNACIQEEHPEEIALNQYNNCRSWNIFEPISIFSYSKHWAPGFATRRQWTRRQQRRGSGQRWSSDSRPWMEPWTSPSWPAHLVWPIGRRSIGSSRSSWVGSLGRALQLPHGSWIPLWACCPPRSCIKATN